MKHIKHFEAYKNPIDDLIFVSTKNPEYPQNYRFRAGDIVVYKYVLDPDRIWKIIIVNIDITNEFGGEYAIEPIDNLNSSEGKWVNDDMIELAPEHIRTALKYNL